MESHEAYSTPIPFEHDGRAEMLVVGGDCITGHSLKDGAEFWRWCTWNPTRITHWRLVPSPVAGGGVVLACAPKGSPVYAFKAGAKGGTQTDSVVAWKSHDREVSSDVATLDRIFAATQNFKPYTQFGTVRHYSNYGHSTYHGLTFRADAFNFLNHSNLNNPQPLIGQDDFGVAQYGRQGRQSGFPAVSPLNETARQVQLILRLEFGVTPAPIANDIAVVTHKVLA